MPVISCSLDNSSLGEDHCLSSLAVRPWIAAPMLAAAIIDGGYIENLTSKKKKGF